MFIEKVTICCGRPDPIYKSLAARIDRLREYNASLQRQIKTERQHRGEAQRIIGKLMMKLKRLQEAHDILSSYIKGE